MYRENWAKCNFILFCLCIAWIKYFFIISDTIIFQSPHRQMYLQIVHFSYNESLGLKRRKKYYDCSKKKNFKCVFYSFCFVFNVEKMLFLQYFHVQLNFKNANSLLHVQRRTGPNTRARRRCQRVPDPRPTGSAANATRNRFNVTLVVVAWRANTLIPPLCMWPC